MSTRAQILAEIAAQFPDNTTGLITPAKLRQVVEDVTNSCLVSETDAGTAGKAVLKAETPAQVRAAAGFGGTVTVAQLNAAGADARSAMYYCSDCLTVNGPGSLVAWCGRTLTWRTLDDCLLATTSFTAWCNDFIANSNASEIRGTKGALFCALDFVSGGTSFHLCVTTGSGSAAVLSSDASLPVPHRRTSTGSGAANAGVRESTTSTGFVHYSPVLKVFAGVRKCQLSTLATTSYVRLALATQSTNGIGLNEDALIFANWNVSGLNPSNLSQLLAAFRVNGVNQAGSGPTGATLTAGVPADLSVVREGTAVNMYKDGALIASGTGTGEFSAIVPCFVVIGDGTNISNLETRKLGFCSGYLLP